MALETFDNAPAYSYLVTVDGVTMPLVMEVSGLKSEVDKIDSKNQTDKGKFVARQLIGRPKPGEFTITRGLTESKTATDWLKTVMEGDVAGARKTAAVELLDYKGEKIKSYNFVNCWVRSVELNTLKAGATEQLTEKIVICFDECEVE